MVLKKHDFAVVFWAVAIISFTFQCYLTWLSRFIVPAVFVYIALMYKRIELGHVKNWIYVYFGFLIFLSFSFSSSLLRDLPLSNILRFFVILSVIPLAQQIYVEDFSKEWSIFKWTSTIKAISIIVIWLILLKTQDYTVFREWAYSLEVGDIYIINHIPRVQILGCSLFVMGFVCECYREKRITAYAWLMLFGLVAAGNKAYILGVFVFVFLLVLPKINNLFMTRNRLFLLIAVIAIIGCIVFGVYAYRVLQAKSDYSNYIRIEQAQLLLDTNLLLGKGLGNMIYATTTFREYSGNVYYELQTLYIVNQIGVPATLVFYLLTILPYYHSRKAQLCAYLVYISYTFWNPYCFDSTHIITVILLTNMFWDEQQNNSMLLDGFKNALNGAIL